MAENLEKKAPNVRFKGFTYDWEQRKPNNYLKESLIIGSSGDKSKKLTVKLWGKGVIPKMTIGNGSENTKYYLRKPGQLIYGKLDFIHAAFGIIPDNLVGYESTIDSPAFDIIHGDSTFLLNTFLRREFYEKYGLQANGSRKAKRIHENDFLNMSFWSGNDDEQSKIGEILQIVDNLIFLYQKKLDLLQQLKKAMLQRMFPDKGTYPKLRFDEFSGPWEQHKLGEVTTSYSGGTPKAGEEKYYSGNIPFIRSAEINSSTTELFISELGLNSSSAKLVSKGMILYALYGATSGEVGISKIDGAINQAILALTPIEKYDSIFISQYLKFIKGKIVQKYLQGGQGNLSASIVKNIDIKFPDCDEQLKISQFLTKFDTLITLQQHKLDNMNKLKKFMLQQMFI